jgi:putative SOS response-associated peptidase YedK
MCAHYTYNKDEAKLALREKIYVYGRVPRAHIKPTDLGPVIIPEFESYLCQDMHWGWRVPGDKTPLINAASETVTKLPTFNEGWT